MFLTQLYQSVLYEKTGMKGEYCDCNEWIEKTSTINMMDKIK